MGGGGADHAGFLERDVSFSWDKLGFRLLVFGGMAFVWICQGLIMGMPWKDLVHGEVAGILPWAFVAPIVLMVGRRIRAARLGRALAFAAHGVGMALLLVPYWLTKNIINLLWALGASGIHGPLLQALAPNRQNLAAAFYNIPFFYILISFGVEAMEQARARREEERQATRLYGQLADARLALLQRQLHPHFLFNALQAISTLIHRDPATADDVLMRLSGLLRALLEKASGQTLTLRLELDLTRNYLEIEQVRFGDHLRVTWRVDESLLETEVPSLVVLPLVENAIRHGLSLKMDPGHLAITAEREGENLVLTVEDDGLGAAAPFVPGVGLGNTRERLRALYGERAGLDLTTEPGRGFRARLHLPLAGERP
jgi:two-component sensor histidine kinase